MHPNNSTPTLIDTEDIVYDSTGIGQRRPRLLSTARLTMKHNSRASETLDKSAYQDGLDVLRQCELRRSVLIISREARLAGI
jgi:hypothetical protein